METVKATTAPNPTPAAEEPEVEAKETDELDVIKNVTKWVNRLSSPIARCRVLHYVTQRCQEECHEAGRAVLA